MDLREELLARAKRDREARTDIDAYVGRPASRSCTEYEGLMHENHPDPT